MRNHLDFSDDHCKIALRRWRIRFSPPIPSRAFPSTTYCIKYSCRGCPGGTQKRVVQLTWLEQTQRKKMRGLRCQISLPQRMRLKSLLKPRDQISHHAILRNHSRSTPYPSSIIAFAMVARGEIGFLISALAKVTAFFTSHRPLRRPNQISFLSRLGGS